MRRLIIILLLIASPTFAQWAEKNHPAGGAHSLPARLFPEDNWWNLNISAAPVDASSQTLLDNFPTSKLFYDFGDNYGIPWITVSGDHPKIEWDVINYGSESDTDPFPIPALAYTEDGWSEEVFKNITEAIAGDRHMLVYDVDNDKLYEVYGVRFNDPQHTAASVAIWDATTNNRRPENWTSSDAAGLQVLPGLVQYDEVFSGNAITHAHRMTLSSVSSTHYWPATKHAASGGAIALGTRFRLKSSKTFSANCNSGTAAGNAAMRLMQAYKDYGIILADTGITGHVTGTNDSRWGPYDSQIRTRMAYCHQEIDFNEDLEIIELGYTPDLNITTTTLPDCLIGQPYSQVVRGTGGYNNYTWTITSGSLPSGLTMTSTGTWAAITGTCDGAEATSNFTIGVEDYHDTPWTDSQALSITAALPNVTITTLTAPDGVVGQSNYSYTVVCEDGLEPYTFTVQAGSLCSGTTLDENSGVISGTPALAQACSYTIRCTDAGDEFDDKEYTPTISIPNGTVTGSAQPGSDTAVIRMGHAGLDAATDCLVEINGSEVATSLSGAARREVTLSGLVPLTPITADLYCDGSLQGAVSFTTLATTEDVQAVLFSAGPPITALATAARWTMECDDDSGLSSPTAVQDTSVGSGASVYHSLTSGLYYCRSKWQTSGDVVLAMSAVTAIAVP